VAENRRDCVRHHRLVFASQIDIHSVFS
jgi:hypothetical protein